MLEIQFIGKKEVNVPAYIVDAQFNQIQLKNISSSLINQLDANVTDIEIVLFGDGIERPVKVLFTRHQAVELRNTIEKEKGDLANLFFRGVRR